MANHIQKAFHRIPDVCEILSLSRSKVYQLIASNRLTTVKEGRTTLVTHLALEEYRQLLERESAIRREAQ